MAYQGGEFDATLAAAAGDDPALYRELRASFLESAARQLDLLRRSRCDGNWQMAALRLQGLASSFHAERLYDLSEEALGGAPGEPTVLRRLQRHIDDLNAQVEPAANSGVATLADGEHSA